MITSYINSALAVMRKSEDKDVKYLYNYWIRTKANPYPQDRRKLIQEFWSIILFETWSDAANKIEALLKSREPYIPRGLYR